jgi:hypothetical protein
MSPEQLAELAETTAQLVIQKLDQRLAHAATTELVSAEVIARDLGVSRDWVYAHKAELGAVPLGSTGTGRKPRWRFDRVRAAAGVALQAPPVPAVTAPRPPRRRVRRGAEDADLLPIRPRSARG